MKAKTGTRVIALRNGVSVGSEVVVESIEKVQKRIIKQYGGRIDSFGNVVSKDKNNLKWEFQLKSVAQ